MNSYLLNNRSARAGERFAGLSALFDRVTFGHFDRLGVGRAWRCWEVGAGGPSVPAHLAYRVGPEGRVVATDIDTTWLEGHVPGAVEVLAHDVASDRPPDVAPFDLVHARLVLVHVPERELALARMIDALAPGGWLLVEDFDVALVSAACLEPLTDAQLRANKIRAGFIDLLERRGVDLAYGRQLPRPMRDGGLVAIGADAYFPVARPACGQVEVANISQVADALVAAGHASQAELEAHVAAVADGSIDVACPPLVSAWGRKR